jgi:hypothetical protein
MAKAKKKYVDVSVTKELLTELHNEMDTAVGMARYGRYKAWLHYANLDSWQRQKWHFAYVDYAGKQWHCTCGLVIPKNAAHEVSGLEELALDAAHRAKGHRALPEFGPVVVAFIFDFTWMEDLRVYFYDALCQVCGEYVLERPGKEADAFSDAHNSRCG